VSNLRKLSEKSGCAWCRWVREQSHLRPRRSTKTPEATVPRS